MASASAAPETKGKLASVSSDSKVSVACSGSNYRSRETHQIDIGDAQ